MILIGIKLVTVDYLKILQRHKRYVKLRFRLLYLPPDDIRKLKTEEDDENAVLFEGTCATSADFRAWKTSDGNDKEEDTQQGDHYFFSKLMLLFVGMCYTYLRHSNGSQ